MSKVAGLSWKKSRRLLESLRDQQQHSLAVGFESANILLSPKYHLRDKDLRKIHKAARVGDAARVQQLLLGKHGVNDRDKKKRTALHIACAYGHPKVVMVLVEGKCEINAIDSDRCTGLVKAVQCQEEECATILLKNGADPNIVDAQGNSALHYAVYYKNTSLATKLLDHEVNIEVINKNGFTPFLLAVSENKLKMAKFLLMKKANIHAVDNQKRTALMHAVSHDSTNLVSFVLQQGVDLFLKDAFGLTATDYAADFKYSANMKILLEYKEKRCEESEKVNLVEEISEDDSSRRKDQWSQELENMKKVMFQGRKGITISLMLKEGIEALKLMLSVSDNLPLVCIGADGLLQVNGQTVAELCLELTSEEKHKVLARNEDNQSQVEEGRRQESGEWEVPQSLHSAALDHGGAGLSLTRKNGKPGGQQSPSTESKEQVGVSALNIKEEYKKGHEKWSSGDFVTELTSEESKSVAGDLLGMKDTWSFSDRDPDKGRPAKRKSKEKHKVLQEMNALKDADDLTQLAEPCSENETGPCSKRQQTETENEPCELLTRKPENVENSTAEEEVMKTEPVTSRVALKQKEKKRENEGMKTQLSGKNELYTKGTENQQCDMALRILHIKVKQTLKQLQEARDRQREALQSSQQMQDHLQKLRAECSGAEVTVQEQGEKIAELQKLWAVLTGEKEEQLRKLGKVMLSLKCSLDQKKNKNEELERELTEIKKHLGIMRKKLNDHENGEFSCHGDLKTKELEMNISVDMLKNEVHELTEKGATIMSKYLPLNVQFKYIEQELLSIKIAQKQYEKLHKDQKMLERDALALQHQLRETMAKSEDKKHARALRHHNNDLVMSQMELRIENLESELEKMEAEEESNTEMTQQYKQHCVREQELSKTLSHTLNKTNRKLSKVRTDILLATERNRTVQNTLTARPAPQSPGVTKHSADVKCKPSFTPSRNPEPPTSTLQPSPLSIRRSLLKVIQAKTKQRSAGAGDGYLQNVSLKHKENAFFLAAHGILSKVDCEPSYKCVDLLEEGAGLANLCGHQGHQGHQGHSTVKA
ncbi:ankyrin repeat domain-containing protein 26-like [Acomys russatus]|uniref:ankyrin repeat domain-containing protein 26-like n=1 Tax=Acomys russatus TaxID=60746 RepID=UPI0021E2DBB8|nr:ankyrin repeat domain-containing protein 26-like [Acomys russatus]